VLSEYFPIAVLFALALILGGVFVGLSAWIGRRPANKIRLMPYECGVDPADTPRKRFSVKFFMVAMIFLLFDVEVTLLFPWATLFKSFVANGLGVFIFIEGLLFIAVLLIGWLYVVRKGALKWE
jgi:NADH-quinone oxidoreductase subunit A